jgi:hypothetical protein
MPQAPPPLDYIYIFSGSAVFDRRCSLTGLVDFRHIRIDTDVHSDG